MRSLASLLLLLLLGCATSKPLETPLPGAHTERPPAPDQLPKPVAEPAEASPFLLDERMPGRYQAGPYDAVGDLFWVGRDQLWINVSVGGQVHRGSLSLAGGPLVSDPEIPALDELYWDRSRYLRSPDGHRAMAYPGKFGARQLVNPETGAVKELDLVRFYGSNVFDSWSPDSRHFLVQSVRTDPVPGFYFLNPAGEVVSTFVELGYFSHWAVWSPDGQQVAFLSVPIDLKYPHLQEEWEELPIGTRVGVLEMATGQARYYSLGGEVFYGIPVWAQDGGQIAIACGPVTTVRFPSLDAESARLESPRPCLLDLTSDAVTPVGQGPGADYQLTVQGLIPGAILVHYYNRQELVYGVQPLDGGLLQTWENGSPQWVADGFLVTEREGRLLLVDQRGQQVRVLSEGSRIDRTAVSPDGTHLAFYNYVVDPTLQKVQVYLMVLRLFPE